MLCPGLTKQNIEPPSTIVTPFPFRATSAWYILIQTLTPLSFLAASFPQARAISSPAHMQKPRGICGWHFRARPLLPGN